MRRWWRDRLDPGCRVGPDQQDWAGSVVDDEAGCRAEACRAQTGAVTVAGCHQQVGGLGSLDDHVLDPTAGCLAPGLAAKPSRGGRAGATGRLMLWREPGPTWCNQVEGHRV